MSLTGGRGYRSRSSLSKTNGFSFNREDEQYESDMTYQIKDWGDAYENAKSRSIDNLSWVAMPNKQDGRSYRYLMRQKGGPEALLGFIATVQRCSRFGKDIRDGWLTDDGTADGRAWDAEDLEMMTDIPVRFFNAMFKLCVHNKIQWLRYQGDTARIPGDTEMTPGDTASPQCIPLLEVQNRTELDSKDGTGQKSKRPTPAEVSEYFSEYSVAKNSGWEMTRCIEQGERFCDHYIANGWKVGGKTAMKDWKAAVRNWHNNGFGGSNERCQGSNGKPAENVFSPPAGVELYDGPDYLGGTANN